MRSIMDAQFWQPIIVNARDLLKVDICVINSNYSSVFISSSENHYGARMSSAQLNVRSIFKELRNGRWEYVDPYGLSYYALEIKSDANAVLGFIIFGPVILNKRLRVEEYRYLLEKNGDNSEEFFGRLEEIRVISHINLETIFNTIESLLYASKVNETSQVDVNTPYGEILNSIFQVSLVIAKAESGSLMIYNESSKELLIWTSKGLHSDYLRSRIGLDNGVSGKAFREQKSYILRGRTEPEVPKEFLNRHDIQESIVMPFEGARGRLKGVLNLNYKSSSKADLEGVNQRVSQVLRDVLPNL